MPVEENEAIKDDDLFSVRFIVAGLVTGANGEKVIENVVTERTATTNGLTLNGGFAAFMLRCNHGMRDEAPKEETVDDTITEIVIKVDNGPHRN